MLMQHTTPEYSLIIPVYNSSGSLEELYSRIKAVFETGINETFEIIMVDDSSRDDSWKIMEKLRQSDPRVKTIQLLKNFGQHIATLCGLEHATGNFFITLDDDLQHPPEEIVKLIDFYGKNQPVDVVFATFKKDHHSVIRNIGSKLLNRILNYIFQTGSLITMSSYRFINKKTRDALISFHGQNLTISSLICMSTSRLANVSMRHSARKLGVSNYNFLNLIRLSISNIFNFSSLPLRFVSIMGLFFSVIAVIFAFYTLYQRLMGQTILPGFASLAILISFFSGLILFSLGILGEYILRILNGVNVGKNYFIRKINFE